MTTLEDALIQQSEMSQPFQIVDVRTQFATQVSTPENTLPLIKEEEAKED